MFNIVNKRKVFHTLFVGEETERKETLMRTTDFLQENNVAYSR